MVQKVQDQNKCTTFRDNIYYHCGNAMLILLVITDANGCTTTISATVSPITIQQLQRQHKFRCSGWWFSYLNRSWRIRWLSYITTEVDLLQLQLTG
jgi:hypothetical protein